MIFHNCLSIDYKKVDSPLLDRLSNNVFYSKEWINFLRQNGNYSPFAYSVTNNEGVVIAIMVGSIESNFKWPLNKLTSRAIIYGGPYVKNNDKEVLRFLLINYNRIIKSVAIYSQFRNNQDMDWALPVFAEFGYEYESHLDIFIDLSQPIEQLISSISRNKRRNVTKSLNKDAVLRIINNKEDFISSLDLIFQTYKRVGLPIANKSYFVSAFESLHPLGILKCFGLYIGDNCIGVRLELVYGNMIYDWYAGSNDSYKNLYPNDVLPYEILIWGVENKFKVFDFGGAGKPDVEYGVRDHKMKFGGSLLEFGRFEKTHKKFLMSVGKLGLSIFKSLKKS